MMMTVMKRGFACVVNRVALSLPPSFLERGGSYGMEHGSGKGGMHIRRPRQERNCCPPDECDKTN